MDEVNVSAGGLTVTPDTRDIKGMGAGSKEQGGWVTGRTRRAPRIHQGHLKSRSRMTVEKPIVWFRIPKVIG